MENFYTFIIFVVLILIIAVPYWRQVIKHQREAEIKLEKNIELGTNIPVSLHPQIDLACCIGCGSCVKACPENVLGLVGGKATIINGMRCIGHGLCADICPVGGITLGFGTPKQGIEIPFYNENFETNINGLYIIGELGGIGLVKNAVNQGIKAIEDITRKKGKTPDNVYDVIIVGAGPAGITASLAAKSNSLNYLTLEQDEIGGTILHYPRQKLVLTSPVELPLFGKLKFSEIIKEELLKIWLEIVDKYKLNLIKNQKVESIEYNKDAFLIKSGEKIYESSKIILALGRRGTPRKLGVPGENLSKVMYRLIDAETYKNKNILVVGGGDSAVEAAVGLSVQKGNLITISYRRESFVRLKEKNERKIYESIQSGKIKAIFNSQVLEINPENVIIKENEILHKISNDFVFIFAGGEMPNELLKKTGVKLRSD